MIQQTITPRTELPSVEYGGTIEKVSTKVTKLGSTEATITIRVESDSPADFADLLILQRLLCTVTIQGGVARANVED